MATNDQPKSPSSINFLEEGLFIPTRNSGLFSWVLALNVVCVAVVAIPYALVISPLFQALDRIVPWNYRHAGLVKEVQGDVWELLLAVVAYLLVATVVSSAVSIVSVHAAVATSFGATEQQHGLGSLLASARGNLRGPILTAVLSNVLPVACTVAVVADTLHLLLEAQEVITLTLPLLVLLLVVLACVFVLYLCTVVFSVSVVVSVAEPGCHGAGALNRAWRLTAAKSGQGVLFMVVQCVTAAAIWPLYTLAVQAVQEYGGLLGFVYVLLLGAVQVVSVCVVTAYYYECKLQIKEEALPDGYAKVQTNEANV